jgi:hypothetical protein
VRVQLARRSPAWNSLPAQPAEGEETGAEEGERGRLGNGHSSGKSVQYDIVDSGLQELRAGTAVPLAWQIDQQLVERLAGQIDRIVTDPDEAKGIEGRGGKPATSSRRNWKSCPGIALTIRSTPPPSTVLPFIW